MTIFSWCAHILGIGEYYLIYDDHFLMVCPHTRDWGMVRVTYYPKILNVISSSNINISQKTVPQLFTANDKTKEIFRKKYGVW